MGSSWKFYQRCSSEQGSPLQILEVTRIRMRIRTDPDADPDGSGCGSGRIRLGVPAGSTLSECLFISVRSLSIGTNFVGKQTTAIAGLHRYYSSSSSSVEGADSVIKQYQSKVKQLWGGPRAQTWNQWCTVHFLSFVSHVDINQLGIPVQ